jgi:ubiquinone/menaquinone biosynthesis C-methylase UbiE
VVAVTDAVETFQISPEAAEAYETLFVPALFADWAPHLVDLAGVRPGDRVLDVGCGTGIVARTAADRLGGRGAVVGVDLNEAMLAVARRARPELDWRQGDAVALPVESNAFDRVLCQSAMMFFPDPAAALREMARAVAPDGAVAVQVWSALEAQPAYRLFAEVVARHAGPEAVKMIGAYWTLGDLAGLRALIASAGLEVTQARTRMGTMRLASIDQMVTVEIESTPLIGRISAEVYGRIRVDAREVLRPFAGDAGVALPIEGHLIAARRGMPDASAGPVAELR